MQAVYVAYPLPIILLCQGNDILPLSSMLMTSLETRGVEHTAQTWYVYNNIIERSDM